MGPWSGRPRLHDDERKFKVPLIDTASFNGDDGVVYLQAVDVYTLRLLRRRIYLALTL
jgi:hypothetical protein